MFTRITKKQAKKLFENGEVVYLVPCNMLPGGMWHVECPISLTDDLKDDARRYEQYNQEKDTSYYASQYAHLWKGSIVETAWDIIYNNWSYYNTNYEMGYYAHYYVKEG